MEPIKDAGRVVYRNVFQQYSIIQDDNGNKKVQVHFKNGTSDVCGILLVLTAVDRRSISSLVQGIWYP